MHLTTYLGLGGYLLAVLLLGGVLVIRKTTTARGNIDGLGLLIIGSMTLAVGSAAFVAGSTW